jgi:hypothetical protein
MINFIIKKIRKFNNIKFRFDLPKKKNILQYDELQSGFLKKIIKRDFNIMPRHKPEIYFWIFIKQTLFFDFTFLTYFKNYIKITSPKIVINLIDNDFSYYKFKDHFEGVHFISIQNGVRPPISPIFKTKKSAHSKNLKCDYFFVFNKYYAYEYKKSINSKYYVLGSYKSNLVKINRTKYKGRYLFISRKKINPKFLYLLASYFKNYNKKLDILLKSKNHIDQKIEIQFYKKFFNSNCIFHKCYTIEKSYNIVDKFENIIFTNSTLGYEAISRKKKVAIFALKKDKTYREYFGWPKRNQKENSFFLAKELNYIEIKRVLDNVYNCKQTKWDQKYYRNIQDLMYFDKNNSQLTKVINKILKYS